MIRREVRDDKTGHLVNIETELEIKDPTMQQALTSKYILSFRIETNFLDLTNRF